MQRENNRDIPFYQFTTLPRDGIQQHAVFTRHGGISSGPFRSLNLSVSVRDSHENVQANRARAYGTLGRSNNDVVHAHLVHGADVMPVWSAEQGQIRGQVDGLVTDEAGCALTMNYADCAPIFIYDPDRRAIGLGHAGWQGAVKDLPGALVRAMTAHFGSDPARLWAGVGPCIGPCCYEVGEPVTSAVVAAFEDRNGLLKNGTGSRPHFDLPEANRRSLLRAGVQQVELSGLCTACRTDLFFSHRAEKGRTGRFGVLFLLS